MTTTQDDKAFVKETYPDAIARRYLNGIWNVWNNQSLKHLIGRGRTSKSAWADAAKRKGG
jgi:hypothetical protein